MPVNDLMDAERVLGEELDDLDRLARLVDECRKYRRDAARGARIVPHCSTVGRVVDILEALLVTTSCGHPCDRPVPPCRPRLGYAREQR